MTVKKTNFLESNHQMLDVFLNIRNFFIHSPINVIFDIGARDCAESIMFSKKIPDAKIYAFECNPTTINECLDNIQSYKNIIFTSKAVSNINGTIKFYPIDQDKTENTNKGENPGASSLFKFNTTNNFHLDDYIQKEIEVPTIRLDDFLQSVGQAEIDMLWMDIQGAELLALEGLGEKIKNVGAILTEVEFKEIYKGQPLFPNLKKFLNQHDFMLYGFTNFLEFPADAIFINKSYIKNPAKKLYLHIKNSSIYEISLLTFQTKKSIRILFNIISKMFIRIKNKITWTLKPSFKKSYSQNGEDIIISKLFNKLKISKPFYLDIGANDPKILSNTFLMYTYGSRGVCIEPDPNICKKINKIRKEDLVLNIAISDSKERMKYFAFDNSYFNTLSKEEADHSTKRGLKLESVTEITPKTLNEVINGYNLKPDFISLDIEGFDEKVLKDFDFKRIKIPVWCIETIEITESNKYSKNKALIEFMTSNGYFVYADTYINTIFVHSDLLSLIIKI